MLISVLSFNLAAPQHAFASGKTHYIAVASDRHETPTAIRTAMGGMPSSVEYVCLNGDMASFARMPRPNDGTSTSGRSDSSAGNNAADSGSGDGTGKGDSSSGDGSEDEEGDNESGGESNEEDDDIILTEPPSRPEPGQNPYNTSTVLAEVQEVFPALDSSTVSIIYASHDANATDDAGIIRNADTSMLPANEGKNSPEISEGWSGLIYTGEDSSYYIYGVSYQDMHDADAAAAAADAFMEWVDSVDPEIPVIVICHVPIHDKRHDNRGGSAWNKALNYAATGSDDGTEIVRDVAFLFGHNHTVEKVEYNLEPGAMLKAEGDEEESTIYYNYITAGYLRDLHTATLIAITDDEISFTKYTGDPDSSELSVPSRLSSRERVKYHTVEFDAKGGSSVDSGQVLNGRKVSRPDDPVRDGYTFTGWFKDPECTDPYDFDTEVTAGLTLYAGWESAAAAEEEEPAADSDEDADQDGEVRPTSDDETTSDDEDTVISDAETAYHGDEDAESGSSEGSSNDPKTGDDSRLILWSVLMLASTAELTVLLLIKRKEKMKR